MEYLSVIQGDALDVVVTVENPQGLPISKVMFVCQSLNIEKELEPAVEDDPLNDIYTLSLLPSETQPLGVGNWNFDIMIYLTTGERYTVIDRGKFEVIRKKALENV